MGKSLEFIVNPLDTTRKYEQSAQFIYTNDLKSVAVSFKIKGGLDLTGASAKMLIGLANGIVLKREAAVAYELIKYELTEAEGNVAGATQAQCEITMPNGEKYATEIVNFTIKAGLYDKIEQVVGIEGWTRAIALVENDMFLLNQDLMTNVHRVDRQSVGWEHLTQSARENISGGSVAVVGVNSVGTENLMTNSVTGDKINGVTAKVASFNLFNKETRRLGGYYNNSTGEWSVDSGYDCSDYIPVQPSTSYTKTGTSPHGFWDVDKNIISGGNWVGSFVTPANCAFVTYSVSKDLVDIANFMESTKWTPTYVPYEEVYVFNDNWSMADINGEHLTDVIITSSTDNLYDKNARKIGGYYEIANNGTWKNDSGYDSTDFIPVKPNYIYKKHSAESYCEWDKNKTFVRGGVARDFITTKDTAFVTFAVAKSAVDTAKLMPISKWSDSYVPFSPKYILGETWGSADSLLVDERLTSSTNNVYLRVPTPYNDLSNDPWVTNQATHPSVVQFANPWNGFRYWMAYTPYPHGDDRKENPCIAVSNDGIKWEVPSGVTLPLVPQLPGYYEYNSDTHLLYNDTSLKIEMWYREVTGSSPNQVEKLKRITSSDGSTWSVPETMVNGVIGNVLNYISPSVIWSGSEYKMWFMRQNYVMYSSSSDGLTWSTPVDVLSNGERTLSWHPSVQLHNGEYHLLNNTGRNTIGYAKTSIGSETNFPEQTIILERTGNEWDLDGYGLYKATLLFTQFDSVIMIYGTMSHQNDWLISAASGRDILHLKPITQRALDFYGVI